MNIDLRLKILPFFLGLGCLGIFGGVPDSPYWILVPTSFGFFFLGTLLLAEDPESDLLNGSMVMIVQFGIAVPFVVYQYRIYGQDSFEFLWASQEIAAGGNSLEIYATPLPYIYSVLISFTSGLPVEGIVKYLPLILLSLTAFFVYSIARQFYSKRVAVLAPILLASFIWHSHFRAWAIKESLGLPIFLLIFYLLLRMNWSKRNPVRFMILVSLSFGALLFTHHLSTAFTIVSILAIFISWVVIRIDFLDVVKSNTTQWQKPSVGVGLIIGITTVYYWLTYFTLPFIMAASPLLGLDSGVEWASNVSGAAKEYSSLYEVFQINWRTSVYQVALVGGTTAIALGYRFLRHRWVVTSKELVLALFSGALVSLLVAVEISGVTITSKRFLIWLWIPALPLLLGALDSLDLKRVCFGAFSVILILNLLAFPYHVTNSSNPAWDAGEPGYDVTERDYHVGDWASEYGEYRIAANHKFHRFWLLFNVQRVVLEGRPSVMHLTPDAERAYIYVTPLTTHWIKPQFDDPSTKPPDYHTNRELSKVYTSGNRSIFLRSH